MPAFERIAVVNRGDAALRCVRAIRELRAEEGSQLKAIALYTDPDGAAPFVRLADEAISLGPALRRPRRAGDAPRPAYLDRARVLAALRATRADAVWPGWGFLAEDPEFAALLEARSIAFIGPPSAVLRTLADKIAAKQLAERCGIPVVPWSGGAVTEAELARAARSLGFPLVIKAAQGGGGRGVRVVRGLDELPAAFRSAAAEAAHAFGSGALFLERRIAPARHIEVQIAADSSGRCMALGLRDCSVQRRNQKIVEEAPPPDLDPSLERTLRDAACQLAQAARYCGVGTVEFLVRVHGREFYFLEVNPRLQVEHGVTEAITGIDLVKLQLRIARGEPLPPGEPAESGHAIEARVCAEDPAGGFLPAPGTVVQLDLPSGMGVRVDAATALGSPVPPEFDSLIAKVIAHGPTRDAARARLVCALSESRIVLAGGTTNKGTLLDILESEDFRRGGVDTDWLSRYQLARPHFALEALVTAAILAYRSEQERIRRDFFTQAMLGPPQALPPSAGFSADLALLGQEYRVGVLGLENGAHRLALDGRTCIARFAPHGPHGGQLTLANRRLDVAWAPRGSALHIEVEGRPHLVGRPDSGRVVAPSAAVVASIDVEPGARVSAGQQLALLEAMKIEIPVTAPFSGTVKEVCVTPNQRVTAGQLLMHIEPKAEAAASAPGAERLALPAERDPLDGIATLAELAALASPQRDSALQDLLARVRRIFLGYDTPPGDSERLLSLLQNPLPASDAKFLRDLAQLRHAVTAFADLEAIFSRAPEKAPDGRLAPSPETYLQIYLRRAAAAGGGLPEPFLDILRRALRHYGVDPLRAGEALEEALLRLHQARSARAARHRLARAAMRLLAHLAEAGIPFDRDPDFLRALDTCAALRGELPEALADDAADLRYALFDLPRLQAAAAAAAAACEASLRATEEPDLSVLLRIADSPAPIFGHIAGWAVGGEGCRRAIAVEALLLRSYAPAVPIARSAFAHPAGPVVRFEFPDRRILLAIAAAEGEGNAAWACLCEMAAREPSAPLCELLLPVSDASAALGFRGRVETLLAQRPLAAQRVCVTAFDARGHRAHITYERDRRTGALRERTDLHGLHPETARRIELERLAEFELERLPAGDSVYAFFARSRSIPDDRRIFVFAEARAAAPFQQHALYEPAFVHVFYEAVRALRTLRAQRAREESLEWNRIAIFVRPPLLLPPRILHRLVRRLAPAARHLGLEKIIVRLPLLERGGRSRVTVREIVAEPTPGERMEVRWREPHRTPLRPASREERRIAEARRRGVLVPAEVIRLFTSAVPEATGPGQFEPYGLDGSAAVPAPAAHRDGEQACGIAFGIVRTPTPKHPEGIARVLIVSDPTADMGALAGPECDRIVAAIDLAERRRLPVEWVAWSSGARIAMHSGTENLDATARVARRIVEFTEAGGEINVIVPGINVGAQSYFDALATMLSHTRGVLIMTPRGALVLTGKRALEVSGSAAAEDEISIGGFERAMGPSGQAHYFARDLEEAYRILLRHYAYTYVAPGEERPRRHRTADPADRPITADFYPPEEGEGFRTVGEIFDRAINPERKRPFAMRAVMRALIDRDDGWLERWAAWVGAETAIVWDAHIGGHPVCLIGIESKPVPRLGQAPADGPEQWLGGTLFPQSAKKVARAIRAASGNRPVVVLANLSGFDGSPESMRGLVLEYGAEIARAVVRFEGPIVFAVVARYHGGAYVVFSRALNDRLTALALEGSYASVIGGAPAAAVVFAREVRARTEADPRVVEMRKRLEAESDPSRRAPLRRQLEDQIAAVQAEKQAEIARAFDAIHTVERARAVGSLDAIVAPDRLRAAIIERLDAERDARRGAQPPRSAGARRCDGEPRGSGQF